MTRYERALALAKIMKQIHEGCRIFAFGGGCAKCPAKGAVCWNPERREKLREKIEGLFYLNTVFHQVNFSCCDADGFLFLIHAPKVKLRALLVADIPDTARRFIAEILKFDEQHKRTREKKWNI